MLVSRVPLVKGNQFHAQHIGKHAKRVAKPPGHYLHFGRNTVDMLAECRTIHEPVFFPKVI